MPRKMNTKFTQCDFYLKEKCDPKISKGIQTCIAGIVNVQGVSLGSSSLALGCSSTASKSSTTVSVSTQCNFFIKLTCEKATQASGLSVTLNHEETQTVSQVFEKKIEGSSQTEIFGMLVPDRVWEEINCFPGKKRKRNKETCTDDLPKIKRRKLAGESSPLSDLEEFVLSLRKSNISTKILKNFNGTVEQIEITKKDSLISMPCYKDIPIKLIFASSGTLTCSAFFKPAFHVEYFDFSKSQLNCKVVEMAINELNEHHVFCPGICKDACHNLEKTKNLTKHSFPYERFQSSECKVWFKPPSNAPNKMLKDNIYQCGKCRTLNRYLIRQQRKNIQTTPRRKQKRCSVQSRCKISALTPMSRNKRYLENRRYRCQQNRRIKNLEKMLKEAEVRLCGEQLEEMRELVSQINEKGQDELRKIFKEAIKQNKTMGLALKRAWEKDASMAMNGFVKDQEKNLNGSHGNRFCALTYRIALSVFSRSPAAYEALAAFNILKLPSIHTLRAKARKIPSEQGIDLNYLQAESDRFDEYEKNYNGDVRPPKEGFLIFDEVKTIGKLMWNSKSDQFVGCALNPENYGSLDDLYKEKTPKEVLEAEYVLQYLWRCAAGKFDIVGQYFMFAKPASHAVITNTVLRCMWAFHSVGLNVCGLVCDGGSSNMTSLRQSLGIKKGHIPPVENEDGTFDFRFSPKFKHPFMKNRWVYWIVCPSHDLKNLINALHHSQDEGTRDFIKNGVQFGWKQIIEMKDREDDRRDCNELAQVKGLLQSHIERDSWTKLNVTPARIMQQNPVLGELYNYANPMTEAYPSDRENVLACYEYLRACNQIFETGLLSKERAASTDSPPIQSMLTGLKYFETWANERIQAGEKLTSNKHFLAWQTFELLRIAVYGFVDFVEDFCSRYPGTYIYPIRINGSAVETLFSQMKYISGGKLTSINYQNARRSMLIKGCTRTGQNAEAAYRKVGLDLLDVLDIKD